MSQRGLLGAAVLAAMLTAASSNAGASTLVIGGGLAKECSEAALDGRSDKASVLTCTTALETENLNFRDRARTFVNRGLANEGLGDLNAAYRDYSRAAALKPDWAAPKTELARFTVKRP